MIVSTGVAIEDHLISALQHEENRESTGEGDCEGSRLSPFIDPHSSSTYTDPHLLAADKRRKLRQRASKKLRQQRKKKSLPPTAYKLRPTWVKKYGPPKSLRVQFNAKQLSAASNAWIGQREPTEEIHPTVDQLMAKGYRYIEWNGRYVLSFCISLF